MDVLRGPGVETGIERTRPLEDDARRRPRLNRLGHREIALDAADLLLGQSQGRMPDALPFLIHLAPDLVGAGLVDEDLDPRLELVVAPAEEIVDAQDRLDVGEDVLLRQEVADLVRDHRRAAEAAADIDGEAELAVGVALQMQPDVVDLDRGAVALGAGHRDLELARQEDEFRVQRRPLPEDLGIGPGIGDLVGGAAGEMIGGDVADAVPRGLDGVHLDRGEVLEDVGDVLQRRPMELQVLARGEVAVAAVVFPRDEGEHPQLLRVQRPVGDRNPQHVGVELEIDAVHQPERLELVLGQFAGNAPLDLIAELRHPLGHKLLVELVVAVHGFRS